MRISIEEFYDDDDYQEEENNNNEECQTDGEVVPRDISETGVKQLLDRFFRDQTMHYGGPIPTDVLHHPDHIKIVQKLEFDKSVDVFYAVLSEHNIIEIDQYKFLMQLQVEAKRKEIPKQYSGGILLVYLKLCKGFDL